MLKGSQDTFEGDERGTSLNVAMMTRVALMAAVTAVAAEKPIAISRVTVSIHGLAVILSGLREGARKGALAQAIYVLVGAVGVPVFAGFKGGLGIVFGDTGGYLLAYPFAAAVAGLAARAVANDQRRQALLASLLCGCAALVVIYALGATWLSVIAGLSPAAALATGVLPFVVFDLVKVVVAALVAVATAPAIAASRT
jgi:biotin transport system substrate-specific component